MFRATSFAFVHGPETLAGNCGSDPGIACRLTWDLSHSSTAAQVIKVYLAGPATRLGRIVFIIILALLVRAIAVRLIRKVTERAATVSLPAAAGGRAHKAAAAVHIAGNERRAQRARALGSILRSGISAIIFAVAALTILGLLGFDLAPLLASTTVLGVALGFGAQNLVRDYLAGILMLTEDHYGVGDTIKVGTTASGTVEAMTLLTTVLRDVNGVVWHIRNGTIDSVGNESQGWSRAVIDYPVPYGQDLARIRSLMEQAAAGLYRERGWKKLMLEKPEVWGAQELSSKEVTMRIVAKTAPMRQMEVGRELRARVKMTLDAAGVPPAGPDTIVITSPGAQTEVSGASAGDVALANGFAAAQSNGHGQATMVAEPVTESPTESPTESLTGADPEDEAGDAEGTGRGNP
ncbi:MAG: mechanosensitive ion channel family protein [Streptosporangiaceae bacterium]